MNDTKTKRYFSSKAYVLGAVLIVVGFSWWGLFSSWSAGDFDQQYFSKLLDRFIPADFSSFNFLLELIFDTLIMALMGTSVGFLVAIPLAAMSSSKLTNSVLIRGLASSFSAFLRAVPDLVFALVAVVVFGFGYLAGAIALALATAGMLARLFSELFDETFNRAALPIKAIGANSMQLLAASLLRVNLRAMFSLVIYRLDINFRSATTLGLVGAGGIGLALRTSIGSLDYRSATAVLVLIIVFVILFESISGWIRSSLESQNRSLSGFALFGVLLVLVISSTVFLLSLFESRTEGRATGALLGFLQPDFSSFPETLILTGESLMMTILAIAIAFLIGSTLGVIASKKAKLGFIGRLSGNSLIVLIRSVPTIVYALILTVAFGLGRATGAIALTIASVGIMAKLTLDSFESQPSISKNPLEAIGLSNSQVLFAGTLREHLSLMFSNLSFVFDVAFRYSLVLGIVGAGGLGSLLLESLRIYDYGRVTVIILVIFVVIWGLEKILKPATSSL